MSEVMLAEPADDYGAYAVAVVATALANVPTPDRRRFLRQLLLTAGDGLRVIQGSPGAAEDVYAIADQMVAHAASCGR